MFAKIGFLFALKLKNSKLRIENPSKDQRFVTLFQFYYFLKMGLTWEEFLQLAAVITNLSDSIYYFDEEEIEIKEKNRRVAAAANEYQEFFSDLKYMKFMEELRTSFKIS